jgi:hypothetical protein
MKYLLAIAIMLFATNAHALKFTTQTFTADGTKLLATIPKSPGVWTATVKSYGTFGGGALTLVYSDTAACTGNPVNEKDVMGSVYSVTAADEVKISHGVNRHSSDYVCATLTGATSPNMSVEIRDLQ